jgi:hypothetical protein
MDSMKIPVICLALFFGQINTRVDKQVVHLRPQSVSIDVGFGGKLLELINPPTLLSLPAVPPKQDPQGNPWFVDVKNLGPSAVTVVGKPAFSIHIRANQTVHIYSNGAAYSQKW